jgi:UDP-N-acetylglucosamine:LPS N-acetylglucosamine transferase
MYRRQLTAVPRSWGVLLALASTSRFADRAARLTALGDRATLAAVGADAAAVVSTYPLASQVLGRLRRRGQLTVPAVTYLTDLSVHPLWIADGIHTHLALHDVAAGEAVERGAHDVRVVAPAVAPMFTDLMPASALSDARARWGLPATAPLALIVAGAWGVGSVERASHDVAATGLAVPVVACGHNDALRRRLNRSGRTIALGWVDDMAALMRSCQVVVQNAGGLSSLEALAAGTPVITYRCLPGHGRSNADALDRAGWAPWIRTPDELAAGLRQALAGPARFAPVAARAETVITELAASLPVGTAAVPA